MRVLLLFVAVFCVISSGEAASYNGVTLSRVRAKTGDGDWVDFHTFKAACAAGHNLIELWPYFEQYSEDSDDFPCHIAAHPHVLIRPRASPSRRIELRSVKTQFFTYADMEKTVLHVRDVAFLGIRSPTVYYSVRFHNCYWHESDVTPIHIKSPPKRGATKAFTRYLSTKRPGIKEWWFGEDVKTQAEKDAKMVAWKLRYNVIFDGCIFYKNSANYYKGTSTMRGGAMMIELHSGQVLINESKFIGNYDPHHAGGAIYMITYSRVMLHIYKSEFTRNMSGEVGGAIYAKLDGRPPLLPSILIANTLFKENVAADGGAAIGLGDLHAISESGALILDCNFAGNLANHLRKEKEYSIHTWSPTIKLMFNKWYPSNFIITPPSWREALPKTNGEKDRLECGYPGISPAGCQKKGCIFSSPDSRYWSDIGNQPWCVFPHTGWFPDSPTTLTEQQPRTETPL